MNPHHDPPDPRSEQSLPQWGRMRPPHHGAHANTAPATPAAGNSARAVAARRRAVRGLSFALIMLGVLLGFGLAALGRPWVGGIAAVPVLVGLSGFLAVHLGIPASLRFPNTHTPSPGRRWWWAPGSLTILGLAAVGGAFLSDGRATDAGSPWTILWLVTAATLFTAAGLGFGLVAASRLTIPDDDDAPLRKVDWDREYPLRYPDQPRDPGGLYDSSWITRGPKPSHSHKQQPPNAPEEK